jgi:cytochrome P450
MSPEFPTASPVETLLFNLVQVLPNSLSGLFSKRERFVTLFTRLNSDRLVVQLLSRMQDKYGSEAVWTRALADRSLLLFGADVIREVLDNSPDPYASDPKAKRQGMGHFEPGALTISRGDEWRKRRQVNEAVLATPERIHPLATGFVATVRAEVDRMLAQLEDGLLEWRHFEELFEKITLRVIFGDAARDDHELVEHLGAMMAEANRVVGLKKSEHFEPYYAKVNDYIAVAEPGSLVSLFKNTDADETIPLAAQVTHWVFAMKDTLAINAFRALAAIVAQPEIERRARAELAGAKLDDPAGVNELRYLEGCFEEAMRLWPTTLMFARETVRPTTLAGMTVPEGVQVLLVNTFNHRNRKFVPDAEFFVPERWLKGEGPNYQFNHLSNGPQYCAGLYLVLFLGKAVLANLLAARRITVDQTTPESAAPEPDQSASSLTDQLWKVPTTLFAGGRASMSKLDQLAREPDKAVPLITDMFKTMTAPLRGGDQDAAGQFHIEQGKPMPYMLNFYALRFGTAPR